MAEEIENEELESEEALPITAPSNGRGLILAFVGLIILMESALFFFLVPSAEQISAIAEEQLIQSVAPTEQTEVNQISTDNEVEEFPLGQFGETFSPIDTERTFRVELDIYGLVRQKDADSLKAEYLAKSGRLRHAIRKKIRNSELAELKDNQLGLLERRILTTCNHLLDGNLLLGIGFNSYQLQEE